MYSTNSVLRVGGAILEDPREGVSPKPLQLGKDVSWLQHCRLGDDQGTSPACSMFAFASWAQIMRGVTISDDYILTRFRETAKALNRPSWVGLTMGEAFAASSAAGMLPSVSTMVHADLDDLAAQPLLAIYTMCPAWDSPSESGYLNDSPGFEHPIRGFHAVAIVAAGDVKAFKAGPFIYLENSWSRRWGWNGLGVMSMLQHRRLCRELWKLI